MQFLDSASFSFERIIDYGRSPTIQIEMEYGSITDAKLALSSFYSRSIMSFNSRSFCFLSPNERNLSFSTILYSFLLDILVH